MTQRSYESRFKKYFNYCQVENHDQLLYGGDTKLIQTRITDFLVHVQAQDLSSSIVNYCLSAIKLFYTMNDIVNINWKKLSRVLKPYRKESNDRPYTREEIAKMLECVDLRGRVVILLMCSSGVRMGAIHSFKMAHLERMGEVYRIIVYHNDPEQYITFCSIECTKAIDDYLEYRRRCGEIIKSSAPLIREQFDKDDQEQASTPKQLRNNVARDIIYKAVNDSGIREKKNVVKGQKKFLHDVMQSHGLRKFFNSQIIHAGMSVLYSEMLMGHKTGLAMQSYVKPTSEQLLDEYMKVVDNVTINEENRLKRKVQEYKIKADKVDEALEQLAQLKKSLGL